MIVPQRGMSGNRYFQPSGFSHCSRYSGQAASRTGEEIGFAFRQGQKVFALLQIIQNSSRASPASLSMGSWSSHRETQKYAVSINQGRTKPGPLNFVLWCLIFASPQYGTCFLSPLVVPGSLRWLLHFLKIMWNHGLDPLSFRFLCHYPEVFLACLDVSKA